MGDAAKRQSIGVSFKDNSGEDGLVHTRGHTRVTPTHRSSLPCGSSFWRRFVVLPQMKCVSVGREAGALAGVLAEF